MSKDFASEIIRLNGPNGLGSPVIPDCFNELQWKEEGKIYLAYVANYAPIVAGEVIALRARVRELESLVRNADWVGLRNLVVYDTIQENPSEDLTVPSV